MSLSKKFDEVQRKIRQTKQVLPKIIANQAQNYFVKSWRMQGFNGDKWHEVQRRIPDTDEYNYPKKKGLSRRTKPILVETGRLRRRVADSIVLAKWPLVRLAVTDVPYAAYHNEGTSTIPQREFMGSTKELTEMHRKTITIYFDKVWK